MTMIIITRMMVIMMITIKLRMKMIILIITIIPIITSHDNSMTMIMLLSDRY